MHDARENAELLWQDYFQRVTLCELARFMEISFRVKYKLTSFFAFLTTSSFSDFEAILLRGIIVTLLFSSPFSNNCLPVCSESTTTLYNCKEGKTCQ